MSTFVITRLTFLEAARRKIALAAFVLGMLFLVLFNVGFYFIRLNADLPFNSGPAETLIRNQVFNFLTQAGMYAINFLAIAMAALVSADTLAGEISSGTIQALVTKPLHRAQIVLGKWLGYAGLLAAYMLLMIGGLFLSVYVQAQYVVPNLWLGAGIIYLEGLLIMSLTLACSSTLSTLATGAVVFGLYGVAVVGGFVETLGVLFNNPTVVNVGIVSSLLMPSEALFKYASWHMTSVVGRVGNLPAGPVLVLSRPSDAMVVYAGLYLLVCVGLAVWNFNQRDL